MAGWSRVRSAAADRADLFALYQFPSVGLVAVWVGGASVVGVIGDTLRIAVDLDGGAAGRGTDLPCS